MLDGEGAFRLLAWKKRNGLNPKSASPHPAGRFECCRCPHRETEGHHAPMGNGWEKPLQSQHVPGNPKGIS